VYPAGGEFENRVLGQNDGAAGEATTGRSSRTMNQLYFDDNLDILHDHIKNETIDLTYLEPFG